MRKYIKTGIAIFLCLMVAATALAPVAFAAQLPEGTQNMSAEQQEHAARQPDYSRTGSITVDILLADGTPVPEGALTAYLVAQAREDDGNNDFVYVEPFGNPGEIVDSDAVNNAEAGAPALAAELAEKIGDAQGKRVAVDADGRVVFENLTLGLYLVVQDTPADGFEPVQSFLVAVPMWDGTQLVYDVYANPKPSISYVRPTLEIQAVKTVSIQAGYPDPAEPFTFRLTPDEPENPMPYNPEAEVDERSGAMTLIQYGEGVVDFGTVSYGLDDVGKTYLYFVEEVPGTNRYYTYESREYRIRVTVSMKDGEITLAVKYLRSDNRTVSEMEFVNKYFNKTTTPKTLPQTGQQWWLVAVLAGAGLVLFVTGWLLNRRKANRG